MNHVKYILLMVGGLAALMTFGLVGSALSWVAFFTIPLGFGLFIMGGNRLERAIEETDSGVAGAFKRIWSSRKLCAAVGVGLIGLSILGMVLGTLWEPLGLAGLLLLPGIGFISKALFASGGEEKQKDPRWQSK